jgi:RimJ/RimL family protein N-acetyltransferase
MNSLLTGEKVSLVRENPETLAKAIVRWGQNSEFGRLLGSDRLHPYSLPATRRWIEATDDGNTFFQFGIRTRPDNRLIGLLELDGVSWTHRTCFTGLGIGEPAYWGRGYGSQALELGLAFAFDELNLHGVWLAVFAYNQRAIRAYEKTGFHHEGRIRQFIHREGQRADMLVMRILQDEWRARGPRPNL